MNREPVLDIAQHDRIVTITLHTNRFSDSLVRTLDRALQDIEDQRSASVVIFRDSGPPFPAKEATASAPFDVEVSRRWIKALSRLERLPLMTLAVIDGTCTAAGLDLALACDHRIATRRSHVVVRELREDRLPGLHTLALARFVGIGVARRIVLLGEQMAAQEALAVGLVDKVCAPEELDAAIEAMASSLVRVDPDTARLARQLLHDSMSAASSDMLGLALAAQRRCLARQASVPADDAKLLASTPVLVDSDFHADLHVALPWLRSVDAIIQHSDPNRAAEKGSSVSALRDAARALRTRFFAHHARAIYDDLCRDDCPRLDVLLYRAADAFPGLLPTRERIKSVTGVAQKEKDDTEIDQALFITELLRDREVGVKIIDAMRRPKPEAFAHLDAFQRKDRIDLGVASLERRDKIAYLSVANRDCLNAENDALLEALELGTDVALLDPRIGVCVLRGDTVANEKYRGRRVFCSGINLTDLYNGRITYLYFVLRELGFVNKLYRGLRTDDGELRKPWISAVDSHAIGGGCQLLLVSDYVVAERTAHFSIPAHHEGFIPGAANLRLPRFVGPRVARELLHMNRSLNAERAAEVGLIDEVVAVQEMESAIERAARALSDTSSFAGNERMLRFSEESDDVFREYMADFAGDQARALFSPELIRNLAQNWMTRTNRAIA